MKNKPTIENKRFIAGAQCPSCKEIDKIFTYEQEQKKFRACVRCEFLEELKFEEARAEIGTRVNRSLKQRDEETQSVRLIDPGK